MKLPDIPLVQDVADYWGIKTLGKFKTVINSLNINTQIVYRDANREQKYTRVIHLKKAIDFGIVR